MWSTLNSYTVMAIFLVVHLLTYMPRSSTSDAVSAATGRREDGSIAPQGFPWGMLATADCATHPHHSLSYWETFTLHLYVSLGWCQGLVLLEQECVALIVKWVIGLLLEQAKIILPCRPVQLKMEFNLEITGYSLYCFTSKVFKSLADMCWYGEVSPQKYGLDFPVS